MESSKTIGYYKIGIKNNNILLEFDDFNYVLVGSKDIDNFFKKIKKEVSKIERAQKLISQVKNESITNYQNFITNE